VWKGSGGASLLYESTLANGVARSFELTERAIVFIDSTSMRDTNSGSNVYATITINGATCASDRFYQDGAYKVSSAACSRVIGPGLYTVTFSAYTNLSSIKVLSIN